MNHLSEDKLIQYAFNLTDSEAKLAMQQHLDECEDCRDALAAVQAKFAQMDVLRDEVPPSEELIQQTLAAKRNVKTIPLYRRRWVEWSAAAAAVALVCILMLQNLPNPQVSQPASGIPKDTPFATKLDTPQGAVSTDNHPGLTATPPLKGGEFLVQDSVGTAHPTINGIRIVSAAEIPDKPPFAPASAIELVVLPKPDKTQVTIYNSADLTLVRDTRKLTLKPGWNWLQFMWANTRIDPTSLSLEPLAHADKVEIQLISYPARLETIGRWLIRSEVEGAVPFEITYFASGLSWRAFYMGTTNEDETMMDLKGYVNISNNSGQDFQNTQTRLIVGQTRLTEEIAYLAGRHYPYGPDMPDSEEAGKLGLRYDYRWKDESRKLGDMPAIGGHIDVSDYFFADAKYDIKQIEKTGLSEYFLYTIEGTENLTNQWTKRLPSFDVADIPVKSLYKYDEDRYGRQTVRFVSFKNDDEHELGQTPIPEGAIKIYRNLNDAENLSYIGQSNIKYISNKEVQYASS